MGTVTNYLAVLTFLIVGTVSAQESFESKARKIANKIEKITKEEKEALKIEIEEVNKQLENGVITKAQSDEKKQKLAEARAVIIENKVSAVQVELNELVQQKVNGKLNNSDTTKIQGKYLSLSLGNEYKSPSEKPAKRTTSQFVFAAGVNNLVTDGSVAKSDFRYWGSHFYEWGLTYNTRILENDNLAHIKYGVSVMYNNLRPTDNRYFDVNGNGTFLETSPINLSESRFRNVYVAVPLHLEFDLSNSKNKDGVKDFKTHQSVRFGIGGYAGLRVKSKQIVRYDMDGNHIREVERGDFGVNDFIYGTSAYIGYKATSLYLKYDLNPLFKDNAIKQNNISLGVRFDFN